MDKAGDILNQAGVALQEGAEDAKQATEEAAEDAREAAEEAVDDDGNA
ncbi:MAG: hypothetical protein PF630_04665 [Gammaproteobacteria bacterium]|jgi:hypothetical protein|nr:hypothetical protein [Gammaproteobacteria bacterium]